MSIGFRIRTLVFSAATFLAAPLWQDGLSAQDTRYQRVQPLQSELAAVADAIVKSSPGISLIWPGYWSNNESFLLISPSGGMLLVTDSAAPAEFIAVPSSTNASSLVGRAYSRDGALPGSQPGTFPGTYGIAGHSTYALPPMGSTLFRRVSFYTHEAFHYHQRQGFRAWASTPEDSIMGLSPTSALLDTSIMRDSTFRSRLRGEDELLRNIASEQSPSALRDLLRQYLAARMERVRGRPDVLAIERRYERREGTATYVGCRAAEVAFPGVDAFVECILRHLGEELATDDPVLHLLRWRPYSVGAVLCLALDRLEVPSWKAAVAGGDRLDEIIAQTLGRPARFHKTPNKGSEFSNDSNDQEPGRLGRHGLSSLFKDSDPLLGQGL
jgi:hypothetical protein